MNVDEGSQAPGPRWLTVADADAVEPGTARTVDLPGRDPIVLWRTAEGEYVAMDDRCPHQWSSLGSSGVVDGSELVCTTHCWRFAPDGSSCKVAMHGRRDEKDPIRTWRCRESGGRVWVDVAPDADARGETDDRPVGDESSSAEQ